MLPDIQPSKIREMHGMAGPNSVNLGLGQPDLDMPPEFVRVVNDVLREDPTGYTGYAGVPELRREIASRVCGKAGTEDNVSITVGSTEGLFASLLTLLNRDDEVLIPDPGFVLYKASIRIVGGKPVNYPVYGENNFDVKYEDIAGRVTSKTRAVIINSPNNPTGRIISQYLLKTLGKLAEERDLYIISDEVYDTIDYTGDFISAWGLNERVLVLGGASKTFAMTGWRLGWVVGNTKFIQRMNIAHHYMVACAPAISQYVLLRLYTDGDIAETVRNNYQAEYERRRESIISMVTKHLGWDYIPSEGAFYLMVKIPDKYLRGKSTEDFAKELVKNADVVTIPGSAFGEQGEGYLRLSFAVKPPEIEEGIQRIADYTRSV